MDKLGELIDLSTNSKLDNLKEQNNKMPLTMASLREVKVLKDDEYIMHSRPSVIGFGWALAWLKEIGIIEKNPVILDLLSMMCIETDLLRRVRRRPKEASLSEDYRGVD